MQKEIWKPILCRHCNQPGFNYKQKITAYHSDKYGDNYIINIPLCQMCVTIHKKYGISMYECTCNMFRYGKHERYHHPKCGWCPQNRFAYTNVFDLNTGNSDVFECQCVDYLSDFMCQSDFAELIPIKSILEPEQLAYLAREELIRISTNPQFIFHVLPSELIYTILDMIKL